MKNVMIYRKIVKSDAFKLQIPIYEFRRILWYLHNDFMGKSAFLQALSKIFED